MKKIYSYIVLLTMTVVLLTGCLQVNIDIGIDERNTAYLAYTITLDVSETDPQYHEVLANTINNLGWYYQEEQDFTAGVDIDADIYTLTMKKAQENSSLDEAFEALKQMLTDADITPFMRVDMTMENYPRQESYTIAAMMDIAHIIERSGAEELTSELQAELAKALETSGGEITLSAPVSEIIYSSHEPEIEDRELKMTIPLSYKEPTAFELHSSVYYAQDGTIQGSVDETVEMLTQTRLIVIAACAALLALLLIILISALVKIKRHNSLLGD